MDFSHLKAQAFASPKEDTSETLQGLTVHLLKGKIVKPKLNIDRIENCGALRRIMGNQL